MVEETVSKFRVKSKILKKPKMGNEGISENLGVTLAEFLRSLILEIRIFLNFQEKGNLDNLAIKKIKGICIFPLTSSYLHVKLSLLQQRKKEIYIKREVLARTFFYFFFYLLSIARSLTVYA